MSEAAAPAAPAAGGNNKMMFIMIGAMFILLLGGMGGMYFMMKGNAKGVDSAEKAGDEHAKEAAPKAAAIYVGFEPPFVVNFPADSPVKFLQLTVQIMTRELAVEHEIKGNDPAIRDALLTLFGQQTADRLATTEGKEELRAKALEAVRGVIKAEGGEADKVEAVYFTSFVMQ
ncbi:MAG: flagellar basal body-associated protein FliL [Steroidobacteraceae bacterium]